MSAKLSRDGRLLAVDGRNYELVPHERPRCHLCAFNGPDNTTCHFRHHVPRSVVPSMPCHVFAAADPDEDAYWRRVT